MRQSAWLHAMHVQLSTMDDRVDRYHRVITAEQLLETSVFIADSLLVSTSIRYDPYLPLYCIDTYSLDCVTRNQTKKVASASNSVANAIESILLIVCVLI